MLLFCKKRMLKSASFDADPNIYYRTENKVPPKSLTFWGHLIFKRHFLFLPSRRRRAVRGEEALSEILILLFVRFFVIIFIVPKRTTHCSSIAQLVEQSAVNRFVVGSSPT